jgi:hypothetical protein
MIVNSRSISAVPLMGLSRCASRNEPITWNVDSTGVVTSADKSAGFVDGGAYDAASEASGSDDLRDKGSAAIVASGAELLTYRLAAARARSQCVIAPGRTEILLGVYWAASESIRFDLLTDELLDGLRW